MTSAIADFVHAPPPTAARPARAVALSGFIPRRAWTPLLFGCALVTLSLLWLLSAETAWTAVGVGAAVALLWHAALASRHIPWFPGIVAAIAAVQWVLATAVIYAIPNLGAAERMAVPPDEYFGYVVPALAALVTGMWLPLRGEGRAAVPNPAGAIRLAPRLRMSIELMLWGGIAARALILASPPASLRFVFYLAAQLSFVAAFSLLLARTPGWKWRLAVLMTVEFLFAARDGMFLLVILWSASAAALLVFRYRLRARWLLIGGALGAVVIMALNGYKRMYRDDVRAQMEDPNQRVGATSEKIGELMFSPAALLSVENLVGNVSRLNQGYITSRVLAWVPMAEPFAEGETVVGAVSASVLPRFLAPDKYVAGGSETVERFTGMRLLGATSMNLSIPGEMYANYGRTGGVLAMFVYGLGLGLVFRLFIRLARRSLLWFAWIPFVMLAAFSAEDGFAETLNRMTKAGIVVAAVVVVMPGWSALRMRPRPRRVAA